MKPAVAALLLLVAGLAAFAIFAGSGGDAAPPDGKARAERERREALARTLFNEAEVAAPPVKLELYGKIVAFYADTQVAPDAHFKRVFYLRHRSTADAAKAFEAAQTFGERHPDDLRVSEAWRWLDSDAGTEGDVDRRRRIQEAWSAFLDQLRARSSGKDAEARARIWSESADVTMRRRDPRTAVALLAEALAWDFPAQDLRLEMVWTLGTICARDLADKARARAAFEEALVLARAGVRGRTEEEIQSALAGL